ncbi:uncharacterized protein PHACADRAFT_195764 [Phanerochaete carnosa HHB-10118-sp]|uniref:F-box domain-containing protein n=1 Tax=Phanerochaete carnosa (strain HHB-10118-sp) TaxID=650164 RepID=K5W939_PHACS|nr:uncharacterized protein PHACADRAFT_195764 [Phanerochaete carnosa HHB-10118-sp]EKM55720.1 hypothetical protein PHACADRAFT_195764 [Phanerochaete carnosa HHB-10118-sp]
MPRPRRTATKRTRLTEHVDDANASDLEPETRPKPTKRARRGKKSRAGLEKLVDMPLDFIYLLVCKLHPLDVLHMARTCRNLRGFFMSRNSERFWQAAAKNVEDLPQPPEGLSWPAYVAFMFSTVCHNCGKGGCDAMFWDCLVRYCSRCRDKLSVLHTTKYDAARTLEVAFPGANIPFPFDQVPLHFLIPVMETERRKFEGDGIMDCFKGHEGWDYSKLDLDRMRDALNQLPPEQICSFIETKAKKLCTLREQTPPLVQWKEDNKAARADERQNAQKMRYESIRTKLIELGWADELESVDALKLASHPLVMQPKPLTDRIWKNIKPQLVNFMVGLQQDRLCRERRSVIWSRLQTMRNAITAIMFLNEDGPSHYQIAIGIPRIQITLKLPSATVVTTESFSFLESELPAFDAKWKNDARGYLSSLIRAKVKIAKSTDPLSLAIASMFKCALCGNRLHYQTLLSHKCYRCPKPVFAERDYCKELIAESLVARRCVVHGFEDEVETLQRVYA